jgi:hypothetical protein
MSTRRIIGWLGAGALALCLAAAAASIALAAAVPVLGFKHAFPNGTGFGVVKPRVVFLGGDPTGEVTKLSWHGWGKARPIGAGEGWCPGKSVAAGHPCAASLHAYNLGRCHGHRAYRTMAFYLKLRPRSHWTLGSRWNICTGRPV